MAPHRIDTHHHIYPPIYLAKRLKEVAAMAPAFEREVRAWTPAIALEGLDRAGIATAMTSMSAPGVWFGDAAAARTLARECNDYAAQIARDHPGRFGVFAALPLPDVEGSLREIEYAFDVLKVDGVGLVTNFGDMWPGDPRVAPVFDELNRRGALVYFHPACASCCANLLSEVPVATIEFPFDTTRAIASLLYGGTLTSCPNIKWLFSHGGGTLPMLAHRIAGPLRYRQDLQARFPNGVMPELKKLYSDIVSVTNPISFTATRSFFGVDQLVFGTDYPFWPIEAMGDGLAQLGLEPNVLAAIERGNALKLFPRLAASNAV